MSLDNLVKAHNLIKEMYIECVFNLKKIGVPIQENYIKNVGFGKLSNTQACCFYKTNETGKSVFLIVFDEKVIEHIEDEEVRNNLKNSMYHELIHTCPDAQNHNDVWLKWANLCDEKFDTKTKRFCEDNIYYNAAHNDVITYKCDECGHEYCTTRMFENDIFCEICGRKMK